MTRVAGALNLLLCPEPLVGLLRLPKQRGARDVCRLERTFAFAFLCTRLCTPARRIARASCSSRCEPPVQMAATRRSLLPVALFSVLGGRIAILVTNKEEFTPPATASWDPDAAIAASRSTSFELSILSSYQGPRDDFFLTFLFVSTRRRVRSRFLRSRRPRSVSKRDCDCRMHRSMRREGA